MSRHTLQVIIGGYYGTGRHGGQISGYLLGLAVKPSLSINKPTHYKSFCKCAGKRLLPSSVAVVA